MDDQPPPRKQLRLITKSRDKVNELLRKGRRNKSKGKGDSSQPHGDSDVEDDVPILSKIPDPALAQNTGWHSHSKNTNSPKDTIDSAYPTSRPVATRVGMARAGKGMEVSAGSNQEPTRTRREDLATTHQLKRQPAVDFSTKMVTAHHQPIAPQPSSTLDKTKFTFQSVSPSANDKSNNPSTSFRVTRLPRLEHLTRKQGLPRNRGAAVHAADSRTATRSKLKAHITKPPDQSTTAPPNTPQASQADAIKPLPPKRHFDSFKIGNNPIDLTPRIDRPCPITNISSFIRPQIPDPIPGPEVYRSFYHKPATIPRNLLERSLPDSVESKNFIDDVESGQIHGRKTEDGDAPAIVNDSRMERVPAGARMGDPASRPRMAVFSGRPVMQLTTHSLQIERKPQNPVAVPENLLTAPGRLAKAYLASAPTGGLKRKRPTGTLPVPSYVHKHTSSATFNIFTNGILLYPELCLLLAARLPVQTLINLYSISKDYHIILNQRLTTVILNQATLKAPAAVRCYPWRCYAHLCQPDPSYKAATIPLTTTFLASTTSGTTINIKPPPPPTHEANHLPGHTISSQRSNLALPQPSPSKRRIPTFRWLHMALHREKTIHSLYHLFAARGVPLPGHPTHLSHPIKNTSSFALSLHKLIFSFDIPDNTRRIAYFRSPTLITPSDLTNLLTFIVKLDMLFNDPLAGEKRDALRKLVMSSVNGLDTLHRLLNKEFLTDEMELLRAWTRYGFQLDREDPNFPQRVGGGWVSLNLSEEDHAASDNVFGIPRNEVGLLRKEFWGKLDYNEATRMRTICPVGRKTGYLMRPDQIVLREAVRRGYKMGSSGFLKAVLSGYVDAESLSAVDAREAKGGRGEVLEEEGEYGVDDVVGGVRALSVDEGGDPLLDLGRTDEGSPLTVRKRGPVKGQLERVREERERLEEYRRAWKEEVDREEERKKYRGYTFVGE